MKCAWHGATPCHFEFVINFETKDVPAPFRTAGYVHKERQSLEMLKIDALPLYKLKYIKLEALK